MVERNLALNRFDTPILELPSRNGAWLTSDATRASRPHHRQDPRASARPALGSLRRSRGLNPRTRTLQQLLHRADQIMRHTFDVGTRLYCFAEQLELGNIGEQTKRLTLAEHLLERR
jgi:hypothetical protein